MTEADVQIGVVRSVAPQRREVRIKLLPHQGPQVSALVWCVFRQSAGQARRFKVEAARMAGADAVVKLVAGVPKEQIMLLEGAEVFVAEAAVKPRPMVVVARDLVGYAVQSRTGEVLGEVDSVYESPGQDTLVITRPDGATWLLPAIAAVVETVDLEAEAVVLGDYAPYLVEEGG